MDSGTIVLSETLVAGIVFIQNAPTQTVGRVHAATTVSAKLRVCNVQKSSSTHDQRYLRGACQMVMSYMRLQMLPGLPQGAGHHRSTQSSLNAKKALDVR